MTSTELYNVLLRENLVTGFQRLFFLFRRCDLSSTVNIWLVTELKNELDEYSIKLLVVFKKKNILSRNLTIEPEDDRLTDEENMFHLICVERDSFKHWL